MKLIQCGCQGGAASRAVLLCTPMYVRQTSPQVGRASLPHCARTRMAATAVVYTDALRYQTRVGNACNTACHMTGSTGYTIMPSTSCCILRHCVCSRTHVHNVMYRGTWYTCCRTCSRTVWLSNDRCCVTLARPGWPSCATCPNTPTHGRLIGGELASYLPLPLLWGLSKQALQLPQ